MGNSAADVLTHSKNHHARFLSLVQTFVLCLVAFQAIDLFLQIDLPSSQESVCTWSLKFCRISTEELSLLVINKTFFLFFCSFSRIYAASTASVRIQIAIGLEYKGSVSYLEYKSQQVWIAAKGPLQRRMAIEMSRENAREIKKKNEQHSSALQFQLIPVSSASRHGIIFHNDTCCCSNITFTYFSFLKKINT